MSAMPNQQSLSSMMPANIDSLMLEFIETLRDEGISEGYTGQHRGPVRHFLVWLAHSGIALRAVDASVIERFLRHDCDCRSTVSVPGTGRWLRPWRKHKSSPPVMRFVRFLEQTGRIETPGELDDNIRLLEGYLGQLRGDGYACRTIRQYRNASTCLIAWLHLSRVPLHALPPGVYERLRSRPFTCWTPRVFHGRKARSPGSSCDITVRRFLGYLASTGRIEWLEPVPEEKPLPGILERFSLWLERNRGISRKRYSLYLGGSE